MCEDDPLVSKVRRELLEARRKELIREAMKSVAANALLGEAPRQGERLGESGLGAMEGSIEAGDLRDFRCGLKDRADRSEVVRLM